MKKFIAYTLLTAAVLIASASIIALTVISQVLNPELYTSSLSQSGVYTTVVDIVETKITSHLTTTAQDLIGNLVANRQPVVNEKVASIVEPMVLQFINQAIDQQAGVVVQSISENIQLSNSVQKSAESGINGIIGWLKYEQPDPQIFQYIPEPSQLESIQSQGLGQFIASKVTDKWGLNDLVVCETPQDAIKNVGLVAQGKIDEITCYSPEIRQLLSKGSEVAVAKIAQTQFAAKIDTFLTTYNVKPIATDLFNAFLSISNFKQQLYELRDGIAQALAWSKDALVISILLLLGGILLTQSKRLKTFFKVMVWIGSIMMVTAFLYVFSMYQYIEKSIPLTMVKIADPAVSEEQKMALTTALDQATKMIAQGLVQTTFYVSLAILFVSAIGLIIIHFKERPEKTPVVTNTVDTTQASVKTTTKKKSTKKTKKSK